MTVKELYDSINIHSELKVLSGYNNKILAYRYNDEKHHEIGEREIVSLWAELKVTNSTFGNSAKPILCCYVNGSKEYDERFKRN